MEGRLRGDFLVGRNQLRSLDAKKAKTNSMAFSPQENYTDRATATCRRNLVPNLADRRVSRGRQSHVRLEVFTAVTMKNGVF
jgi:hypothetical protein